MYLIVFSFSGKINPVSSVDPDARLAAPVFVWPRVINKEILGLRAAVEVTGLGGGGSRYQRANNTRQVVVFLY